MRFNNEIRVGAVVLAGIFVIIYGYFYLRNLGLGADTYQVRVAGAAQIAAGNDVRLQGVKIGQVQEVTFDSTTQDPILTLAVRRTNPPIKLLRNYRYTITTSGVIGDSYLDIRGDFNPVVPAYVPNDPTQFIPAKAGGGLQGLTQSADEIIQDFRTTMVKVNTTLDKINNRVLGDANQVKLAQALEGVARLTNNAAKSFGPEGVRFGFGDARAQANLNATLRNTAEAARYAQMAAQNISQASGDGRALVRDLRMETNATLRQNRGKINSLLASMDKAANNVAGVTETLDFALKQGGFKENAQLAFQSLRKAAENVEVATSGLRRLGEDQATQDDMKATLKALRAGTEALRDTTSTIKTLVSDPGTNNQLRTTLTTLGETSQNLKDVTAGLKGILGDAQLQSDVKGAAANLNGTLAATRAAAERVNSLLGGRRGSAPKTTGGGAAGASEASTDPVALHPGYSPGGIDFTYRYLYNKGGNAPGRADNSGRHYADVTYNAEFFGGPFRLGAANIGDGTGITAQTGMFLGQSGAVRYGIYRSELGAGVDFRKGKFSLEGNWYDPNSSSYNLYGGYQVTPNLEVLAGRESIRGTRANTLGIRIRP